MGNGLELDRPDDFKVLKSKYIKELEHASVLIDLGDFSEEKADRMIADDHHIRVFGEILGLPDEEGGETFHTGLQGSIMTKKHLKELVIKSGKLEFGLEYIPTLIQHAGKVKTSLTEFVRELRDLVLS
jgi:hypothetical protein